MGKELHSQESAVVVVVDEFRSLEKKKNLDHELWEVLTLLVASDEELRAAFRLAKLQN
jgi:hypothetical protein